eukprot:1457314-Pyramimonas_sp.AAC.1
MGCPSVASEACCACCSAWASARAVRERRAQNPPDLAASRRLATSWRQRAQLAAWAAGAVWAVDEMARPPSAKRTVVCGLWSSSSCLPRSMCSKAESAAASSCSTQMLC